MNIFIVYLLCCNLQVNPYFICHVEGDVRIASDTMVKLKPGIKIRENEPLLFKSAGARLLVVNNKGVFEIKNRKSLPTQPLNNVLVLVKDHILPCNTKKNAFTKDAGSILDLEAMEKYLTSLDDEEKPTLLLATFIRFQLNRQNFTEINKNYFFLRYKYRGEPVQQKLPYTEPQQANGPLFVEINKTIFLKNNTLPDTAEIKDMQLYYQYGDTPEPVHIIDLAITIANREALLDELKVVVQQMGPANGTPTKESLQDIIAGYLKSNYGYTNKEELSSLFPELFK